jgi:hypothetical protein
MAIRAAQQALGRIFFQRCFYLFVVLLAFDTIVPFVELGAFGKFAVSCLNSLVIVSAVAAVGRTVLSFVIVSLLALAALVFFWLSMEFNDPLHLARAWGFGAALDLATIVYLLVYVFRPEVMTTDKLFGAAAAYLMIGSFWAELYALTNTFYPGSFGGLGDAGAANLSDFLYFSYSVLSSGTGFGDIVPKTRQVRAVCNVEQLTGALYVAILIARLAGVYPPMPQIQERRARLFGESKEKGKDEGIQKS